VHPSVLLLARLCRLHAMAQWSVHLWEQLEQALAKQ
jgi:hypothetical protein